MLIQDFKVKKEPARYKSHRETCESCRRVETLYREYPGFKANIVFNLIKPCLSILKKPRPEGLKIIMDYPSFRTCRILDRELKYIHLKHRF